MLQDFMIAALFFLAGWLLAVCYYKKASEHLAQESAKLRRLSEMILRWLELNGESVAIVRGDTGEIKGLARVVGVAEGMDQTVTPNDGKLEPSGGNSDQ